MAALTASLSMTRTRVCWTCNRPEGSFNGKVEVILCTWWNDYLDKPVQLCQSCIASARRQLQYNERDKLREQRLDNGGWDLSVPRRKGRKTKNDNS